VRRNACIKSGAMLLTPTSLLYIYHNKIWQFHQVQSLIRFEGCIIFDFIIIFDNNQHCVVYIRLAEEFFICYDKDRLYRPDLTIINF